MSIRRFQFVRPLVAVAMVAGSTLYADRPAAADAVARSRHHRGRRWRRAGRQVAGRRGRQAAHDRRHQRIVGITKIALSDIKVGSFIGTTTVPGPDGSQNAVEVHVFPEAMRGTGEGSRPYDLQAQLQHDQRHGGGIGGRQ